MYTLVLIQLLFHQLCLAQPGPPSYSTTLETELRDSLFTNYSVLQRPDQTVKVEVTFNLMALNSLDIKEQTMKTSAYFTMGWKDSRLDWSTDTTYSNIPFLFSTETYMWRPAVIVENSVESLEVISDDNVLMRIVNNGQAVWSPSGIYVTSCDADVTYYPLDSQTCEIILSTWAYTSNEIEFEVPADPVDTTYYSENGEWEFLGHSSRTESASRESQSFSRIYFSLTFRRKPLFHILNTIIPVVLMAFLMTAVFKLPPESGERIGLSLTTLLAYAVYLTLISDNIPQTSKAASVLSMYLVLILFYSASSVFATILVLSVYFIPDEEDVPEWLQNFTRVILVRTSFWKGAPCSKKGHKIKPGDQDTFVGLNIKRANTGPTDTKGSKLPNSNNYDLEKKERLTSTSTSENDLEEYNWREIAAMMDKSFLYSIMFLVLITTVICLSVLGANY